MRAKLTLSLSVAFLASMASAQATEVPLAGVYAPHTADCVVGGIPADAIAPLRITVAADASGVEMTIPVHTQYSADGVGTQVLASLASGDISRTALGGSTFRTVGTFSEDGRKFDHREYDNEAAGLPLRELRGTIFDLTSERVLTITQLGEGLSPRVCLLSRVD